MMLWYQYVGYISHQLISSDQLSFNPKNMYDSILACSEKDTSWLDDDIPMIILYRDHYRSAISYS